MNQGEERARLLKEAGLSPKAFCTACWCRVKVLLVRLALVEDANRRANRIIGANSDELGGIIAEQNTKIEELIAVGVKLKQALEHAERRLNQIPHNYDETDFTLIRRAKQAAEELKL
jgi:hypothetical protein